jgi:hypothetical protein
VAAFRVPGLVPHQLPLHQLAFFQKLPRPQLISALHCFLIFCNFQNHYCCRYHLVTGCSSPVSTPYDSLLHLDSPLLLTVWSHLLAYTLHASSSNILQTRRSFPSKPVQSDFDAWLASQRQV